MLRQVAVFLASAFALPVVAAIAFSVWSKPPSMLGAILLTSLLLTAYCVGASLFQFPSRATIAGLLTGALLFNTTMIVFDWALTHPEAQPLTLGGTLQYLQLYGNSGSVAFLVAPFLLSLMAFLAGRSLSALLARFRT